MERLDQRQGFLISALAHLVIIMALASRTNPGSPRPVEAPPSPEPEVSRRVVFLPPPAQLREILPPQSRARPVPTPPSPPPAEGKDRISIGPPIPRKQQGPLVLRKEDDLTAVPKGRPDSAPATPPPVSAPPSTADAPARGAEAPGTPGLRLPAGVGEAPRGEEGSKGKPGSARPSITNSLKDLEARLRDTGPLGLPSGTGQQMGPLFFDPRGADFTLWINHFKNEVYENWIIPQPALMGFRGHVDLEFTVERDGTLTNLKMLKSSGTVALDRAAQNALLGSRLLALPSDFAPPRVTMQVTFYYSEAPSGS